MYDRFTVSCFTVSRRLHNGVLTPQEGCYGSYIPRHRRHQHAKMFSVSQRVVGNRGGMYELNGRVPRSPDTREIENVQDTV
ncbi:hypothetical protein TNIN_122611 [Trichonephila inaurata madagascariensis]|uniref:Uncharacterized protein n=1 Tax=Trichonephila inaurata madagascariensis TaxID=2747483 RepID=A0A8X7BV98_9ARAC|nr:hypothetical protein TNIN_122611 [Trichonephila inaurata madagascariensis]